ncbi:hypothetical protein GQ457_02G036060 [Hibiscus cannabinus]
MIESLFGYNVQNTMKNDEAKSKTSSPSKHVLEPKRLQNITILLKALNVTAEQAGNALMKVKMVPTKEEEDKLYGFKRDTNYLGSAEKFVKAILSVPFAFLRAEAMLYRETFDDEVVHLKSSFSMLEELEEDEHKVLLHAREITEYFQGDVSKLDEANPLRILVIVRDFMGMLDHVCKELRNLKLPSSPSQ